MATATAKLITVNKSNWTGQLGQVEILDDTFRVFWDNEEGGETIAYLFRLEMEEGTPDAAFRVWSADGEWSAEWPLVTGHTYRWLSGKLDVSARSGDLDRTVRVDDDADDATIREAAIIAAAQVLWMTV